MRKLVVALVLAAVMFGGMGTGVAFADHSHGEWAEADSHDDGGVSFAPAGAHLFGDVPGSPGLNGQFNGIFHNPNCPQHDATW